MLLLDYYQIRIRDRIKRVYGENGKMRKLSKINESNGIYGTNSNRGVGYYFQSKGIDEK